MDLDRYQKSTVSGLSRSRAESQPTFVSCPNNGHVSPAQEHIPELWTHFSELGVESHMFASQWFLTLYTAKFPLYLVFNVLDVFLLKDMDWIFQVAIALLLVSCG